MNVRILCENSFSEDDQEIVDKFVEFQEALVQTDLDKLDEILLDGFEYTQIPAKPQSKKEFILKLNDGSLDFSTSEIMEPTILFDNNSASLMAKVRLTANVNGRKLSWISNTVANFEKINGNWYLSKWDN